MIRALVPEVEQDKARGDFGCKYEHHDSYGHWLGLPADLGVEQVQGQEDQQVNAIYKYQDEVNFGDVL